MLVDTVLFKENVSAEGNGVFFIKSFQDITMRNV